MSEAFNPYRKWLGIPPKDQPPNYYRLLAIEVFEDDPDVIEAAADQRMAHIRTYQTGRNGALSQRILNELSAAKICLLDLEKKAVYDDALRSHIAVDALAAGPAATFGRRRPPRRRVAAWKIAALVVAGILLAAVPIVWLRATGGRMQPPQRAKRPATPPASAAERISKPQVAASKPHAEPPAAAAEKYRTISLGPRAELRLVRVPASPDGRIAAFYLGETEVTQRQWTAVMGAPPVAQQSEADDLPVAFVSFDDSNQFAAKMEQFFGDGRWHFRLPTNDEFAYAYQGGHDVADAYLDDPLQFGWLKEESHDAPHPVAQKRPNAFGLFDVLGNVWEWTSDDHFYGMSAADSLEQQPQLKLALTCIALPPGQQYETYRGWNVGLRIAADGL